MIVKLTIKNFPKSTKIKDIKSFFADIKLIFTRIDNNGNGFIEIKEKDVDEALKRNQMTFKKHIITVKIPSNDETTKSKKKNSNLDKPKFPVVDENNLVEQILDTGRLFLRNLSFDITEEDVVNLFKTFGELVEVHVPYDLNLKRTKGYGYVTFMLPKDAVAAFKSLDKTDFKGRKIHILPSNEKPEGQKCKGVLEKSIDGEQAPDSSSFKTKKLEEMKSAASSAHNWNALFVNSNVVAQYLADESGVTIEELYSGAFKGSISVKLAQAETLLVSQMRRFMIDNRIRIDVLEAVTNRGQKSSKEKLAVSFALSSTTFIVKNLTPGVKEEELRELFGKYPGLEKVLLPPYGVTAIVSYNTSQQAKVAYQNCAYMGFKETVLMLQWAPLEIFEEVKSEEIVETSQQPILLEPLVEDTKKSMRKKRKAEEKMAKEQELKKQKLEALEATEMEPDKSKDNVKRSTKVIVKNISFQCTYEELKELFGSFEGIVAIRLPKKTSGGHKGFAYVEFETEDQAEVLIESMGISTHLLGRRLNLEYSKS